jgi:hypothetical protein
MAKVKPTLDMDLGRHARKATVIMRERGWVTGTLENRQGQVCLVGAMYKALSPVPKVQRNHLANEFAVRFGQWMMAHHQRGPEFRANWGGLGLAQTWNDCVFTSEDETVAWLNKYADAMDPQR